MTLDPVANAQLIILSNELNLSVEETLARIIDFAIDLNGLAKTGFTRICLEDPRGRESRMAYRTHPLFKKK